VGKEAASQNEVIKTDSMAITFQRREEKQQREEKRRKITDSKDR